LRNIHQSSRSLLVVVWRSTVLSAYIRCGRGVHTLTTSSGSRLFWRIPGSSATASANKSRRGGGGSSRSRLKAPNCLKPS
jgi:hypothetical protein